MTEERQLPQLIMRRASLSDLPPVELPDGIVCRHFAPGDETAWESIVEKAFGWKRSFREEIASHPYFRPERVLFLCIDGTPVATACAWHEAKWGEDCGYLHMVGVDPRFAGRRLGYWVSLAALRRMAADGMRQALLETDDFRLAAVKTYLGLGFLPDLEEERIRTRWKEVYRRLRLPFGVRVQAYSRPGVPGGLNEDALIRNPRDLVYGVADGVSAMVPYRDENGLTGGAIAAAVLAGELQPDAPVNDLRAAVLRANEQLLERMRVAGIDTGCAWHRWGAVFAVVRICERHVEYVQSGDCMLLARYRDGSVRLLSRNQVAEFDGKSLKAKRQLREDGSLSDEEIALRLVPVFRDNRNQANAPDGYSVMNGDPALEHTMESGRLSKANLRKLYAFTDGLFHLIEYDPDPLKWEKLADALDEKGIEGYIADLTEREDRDPSCTAYPRHKKSDDKSAVIVELASS
ncbi:GNAT family N-acetyltransferase [Cohnella zeiphila]|uniref:GNAT family N-acetyltransferase n=1 Tax=Cohnella zeiphila TaxID=2761120 RepID=A0A7X0VY42_9BACL|nr:GNAT family N-acetyltransferase [Cohnella zeiphila]MBB6734290.1 GNAT family N-acetyltransferase [Cohnella zeiphila]